MDILSHALIGKVIAARKHSRRVMYTGMLFSIMPDLFQIPLYLVVGTYANRFLSIPQIVDWVGFRAAHPVWTMLWEIPHSVFFLILIIVPLVVWLKLPKIGIVAYGLHIFIDVFSHTGEWAVKPLYPFNYSITGFTDGWAWSWQGTVMSWIILFVISVIISKYASPTTRSYKINQATRV